MSAPVVFKGGAGSRSVKFTLSAMKKKFTSPSAILSFARNTRHIPRRIRFRKDGFLHLGMFLLVALFMGSIAAALVAASVGGRTRRGEGTSDKFGNPIATANSGQSLAAVHDRRQQSTLVPLSSKFLSGWSLHTPNLGPWSVVANYPLSILQNSMVSDGTYAYSAGGTLGINNPEGVSAFYRYDPVTNAWTQLPDMPHPVWGTRAAYAENTNSVYIFGGLSNGKILDSTLIYHIDSNSWTVGAPLPSPLFTPSVAYYPGNGKIYVIGGYDLFGNETNRTWEYDPLTNTWDTSRTNIPLPMGDSVCSIVGNHIYLAGSSNFGFGSNYHFQYDILTDSWSARAPVPVVLTSATGAAVGTQTYVIGGLDPYLPIRSTYIYDTISDTWSQGPDTNVPHAGAGGTAIGNLLIVVGGINGKVPESDTVETSLVEVGPTPSPSPTPKPTPTPSPGPCPLQVLIVYTDTGVPSQLRLQIQSQPGVIGVDLFDAQSRTPALADLQRYDVVVVYSWGEVGFQDADTLGNNLADYVDSGGVVVQAGESYYNSIKPELPIGITGRWLSDGYPPFDYTRGVSTQQFFLGDFDADHPLMAGVSILRGTFMNLVPVAAGSLNVAQTYGFGFPLIAARPVSGGHTTVGISACLGAALPVVQGGDWGKVIVNAGKWLLCSVGGTPTPTPTATASATPNISPTPSAPPRAAPRARPSPRPRPIP